MRLASSEITELWSHYTSETMALQINQYASNAIQSESIKGLFSNAIELSKEHIRKIQDFFKEENFPTPQGFTNDDVNLNASALFTERFWLEHLYHSAINGNSSYSLAFNNSVKKDIREFYYQCIIDSMNIYNQSIEILLEKGWYDREPGYITPKEVEFVDFKYELDIFGKHRLLNSMEVGNIYFNLKKANLSKAMVVGFHQICKDEEIKILLEKGLKIINKHIGIFSKLLIDSNLHTPNMLTEEVIETNISPFSDKLIVQQVAMLFGVAVTYYTEAAIKSLRIDLVTHCETAMSRALKYLLQLNNIMVKNNWLEKPPMADDKKKQ